jgi:hypothetical protein
LPARQVKRYNKYGGGYPTIANIKEETCCRRSLLTLVYIPSLASHNIRGFLQPRLVEVATVSIIGEALR